MGSRVRVEQFDDFDGIVRPDVQTYQFMGPDGVLMEIDLHAEHFAEMELDFAKYIKAGRKAKRKNKKHKSAATAGDDSKRQSAQWPSEIHDWAAEHGYDWYDKEQRNAVREWAFDSTEFRAKVGTLPKWVLEAHFEARENDTAPWPFGPKTT